MERRKYIYSTVIIIFLGTIAYMPSVLITRFFITDSYCYMILAANLSGLRYSLENYLHLKYLPAYPGAIFIINFLSAGFTGYLYSAKLVSMLSLIATSLLVFDFMFRHLRSNGLALFAGMLSLLSPIFIFVSGNILSESLFCLFSFAAFYFMKRPRNYIPWILAALAILTRWEGILLIPALVLMEWKNKKRFLLGLLIIVIICSPWIIFILSHLGQFIAFSYPGEIFIRTHTGFGFIIDLFYSASPFVFIFGLIGFIFYPRPLREGVMLYIIAYSILHIIWHYRDPRFALPIVPFFTIGAVIFFQYLLERISARKIARHGLLSAALFALVIIPLVITDIYVYFKVEKFGKDPRKEAVQKILEYDPNAVVLTNIDPHLCKWYGLKNTHRLKELDQEAPYNWLAEKYFNSKARFLIWSVMDPYSLKFFRELGQKGFMTEDIQYEGRDLRLFFYPIVFLDGGNMIIFNLEVKPEEPRKN